MPLDKKNTVDVAICVYGKPFQTALTLKSLMKHSGQHINKIYVQFEKNQPKDSDLNQLKDLLKGLPIEYFEPQHFFWIQNNFDGIKNKLKWLFPKYRHAIRYQYAWEKSSKDYLLVIHNDVLFQDDLIGYYLENIRDFIGIGRVGQCWNCPASNGSCKPESYWDFKPNMKELQQLYVNFSNQRAKIQGQLMDNKKAWPLPECRLNELAALINLKTARKITFPKGMVPPFGAFNALDIGIEWFKSVNYLGFKVKHLNFEPLAIHAWANEGKFGGHFALSHEDVYVKEENMAKELLNKFNF